MGNFHGSSVKIELDHAEGSSEDQPLPAGSLLRGKVVVEIADGRSLQIPKNATTDACIQLRLYGKEKVCMDRRRAVKTKGSEDWRHRTRKDAERPFLDVRLQWSQFPQVTTTTESNSDKITVPPGIYAFPFQMQLPKQLPSSTYHPIHRDGSRMAHGCRIQYKLRAYIDTSSGKEGSSSSNSYLPTTSHPLSDTTYLWVAAVQSNTRRHKSPCFLPPVCTAIPGVLQSGNLLYGAAVEDCAVEKGGDLLLHIACRNDSPTEVSRVTIRLLEQLTWGTTAVNHVDARTGACTQRSTLQQTDHLPVATVPNVNLPGVDKVAKSMFKAAMDSFMGVEQSPILLREMHRDLTNGQNRVTIPVPTAVRESFTGQLVQVSHLIRIDFITAGFAKSPQLEIPITVLSTTQPASLPPGFRKGAGKPYCIRAPDKESSTSATNSSSNFHPPSTLPASPMVPATTGQHEAPAPPPIPTTTTTASTGKRPNKRTPLVASPEPESQPTPTIMANTGLGTVSGSKTPATAPSKPHTPSEPADNSSLAIPTMFTRPFSLFSKPSPDPQQQQQPSSNVLASGVPTSPTAPSPEARDECNVDLRPALALAPAMPVPGFEPIDGSNLPIAIASAPIEPAMMQVGGESIISKRRGRLGRRRNTDPELPTPLALPKAPTISLAALRHEMHYAINCYDLVSSKLLEPSWTPFFQSLSPEDFGTIISYVDVAMDQPRVAVLLAPHVQHGRGIDSRFVVAAIRHANSQHKATLTQRLLPLLEQRGERVDHAKIRAELNEWEQTVVYASLQDSQAKQHRLVTAA